MENKLGSLFNCLKNKIPEPLRESVEHKTSAEIEKIATKLVDKLLADLPKEDAPEEIRQEILNSLLEHPQGQKALPSIQYVRSVLASNKPKDLHSLLNLKKNIVQTLIADAKKKVFDRNTVDAEIISP